jgi:hemoglobin/transferrin/lactoferrin receptor protein
VISRTRYITFSGQTDSTETGSSVPKNSWNELGVYASGETSYDKLSLTAGARLDNFWIKTQTTPGYVDTAGNALPTEDETYTAVNGSFGLVYPLTETVNLVGNVGTAYRVPNVVERFYYGSASNRETRPNPDIKPERSISFDFGVKAVHEEISYSLMGFYSDYRDFTQLQAFDSVPGHAGFTRLWRYENIDDVRIYGFESIIEGNFENGLYGSLAFSYQHGQNRTLNQPLYVSPIKTTATVGYRYPRHGLFGEVTMRVVSDQDRVPDVTFLDDIATNGFTVVNLNAGARLFDRIRLILGINNLFDEVYAEPFNARNPDNPVPEPGRSFVVGLATSL